MTTNAAQTLNAMNQNNMIGLLEIEILEATVDRVVATMPVKAKVHQPFGLLHGGASVALAETVASLGAYLNVMDSGMGAVGLEINANHLRGKKDGVVTATATPIHKGRITHVWQVEIRDEAGKMVCVSRCTLAIVPAS
jgi:1,4-dihydroxy-2-naphthoyl-CoA hydrolase